MNRAILGAVLVLAVAVGSDSSAAPDSAACCVQSTSRMDAMLNPAAGGDEKFFTISGTIPNVVFMLDSSGSMNQFPTGGNPSDCNTTGCDCFGATGYDGTTVYPPEVSSYDTVAGHVRLDGQGGRTGWFAGDRVYELLNGEGYTGSTPGDPRSINPAGATWTGVTRNDAIVAACKAPDGWVDTPTPTHCGSCTNLYSRTTGTKYATGADGTCSAVTGTCRGHKRYGNCNGTNTACQNSARTSCTNDGNPLANCQCQRLDTNWGCYATTLRDTGYYCGPTCPVAAPTCAGNEPQTVCYARVWAIGARDLLCENCLGGANAQGYYTNRTDHSKDRAVGNFLNTYAPKYLMVRRTVKEVLASSKPFRIAGVHFKSNSGSSTNPDEPQRFQSFTPTCANTATLSTAAGWDLVRNNFINGPTGNPTISLNSNVYNGSYTPLMKSLLMSGYMFTDNASVYSGIFTSNWLADVDNGTARMNATNFTETEPVCAGCSSFNAIVLLTDGQGNGGMGDATWETKLDLPANLLATGKPNYCDSGTTSTCFPSCPPKGTNNCQSSDLDELAYALHTRNLSSSTSTPRSVTTYTVGFGLDDPPAEAVLAHAGVVGGGLALTASNGGELSSAFEAIFEDIAKRSTSFSTTSISSMQTGNSKLTAIMPRMSPDKSGVWAGRLYRFALYNEFVEGGTTDPAKLHPERVVGDLIPSIFVVDRDNHIIKEDGTAGGFLRRDTSALAAPYWEANDRLKTTGHASRKIYTVVDCSAGSLSACTPADKDGLFDGRDLVVDFSDDNVDVLLDYLGIRGSGGTFCPSGPSPFIPGRLMTFLKFTTASAAATALGYSFSGSPSQLDYDRLCGSLLINYVRGQDLAGTADPTRLGTRTEVLGDIFHSSPIVVEPPADPFLCDLGLSNQCVRTAYSQQIPTAATPLDTTDETDCSGGPVRRNAYDKFAYLNGVRDKLIVVGANDGMLHAFTDGRAAVTCAGGVRTVTYDQGTGNEAWAFIPPDILPRLQDLIDGSGKARHQYLMDADIMVRDVWADGSGSTPGKDGRKQADEFHTVAIAGEGRGGTHYFAMDLRFDPSTRAADKPGFLWMFPQPCSPEAAIFGKTLLALTPKPPPIGPVLLQTGSSAANRVTRYGLDTEERWVAMLSGGWSPNGEKGHGIYMVDVWGGREGTRKDNLLWKFEQPANAPALLGQQKGPTEHLTQGFAAPVAMVDYGANDGPSLDGFFDTGIVGDLQGQLWVARFHTPGTLELDPNSPHLVTNWAAARAFEQDRDAAVSTTGESGAVTAPSIRNRGPFYFLSSVGVQPDTMALRAFAGTGNRYSLLDPDAGSCRFDNPLACAKYGCEMKASYQGQRGDVSLTNAEAHFKAGAFLHGNFTTASRADPGACGVAGTPNVTASLAVHTLECPKGMTTVAFPDMPQTQVSCGLDAAGTAYTCSKTEPVTPFYGDENANFTVSTNGLGDNRFYGVWLYGRDASRMFDETKDATGSTWKTASEFDANRLTDRTSSSTSGDLTDVTCTQSSSPPARCGIATAAALPTARGWFFDYERLNDKTASSGSLLASCVLWNSASPDTSGSVSSCTAAGASARLYQADFITGAADCSDSFKVGATDYKRYKDRTVIAPPPEPATVVQISPQGKTKYSSIVIEAGSGLSEEGVSISRDGIQVVYEIPVSRSLHFCRHRDRGKCSVSPP